MKHFGQFMMRGNAKRSLQVQLADGIKAMIQTGNLRPKERMPSTRSLAEALGISRNTVVAAYELLGGEGYIQGQERSVFIVGMATEAFRANPRRSPAPQKVRRHVPRPPVAPVPFRPAQPDVNLFSLGMWNRHRTRVLKRGSHLLHYQSRFSMGLDELRQAVAGYLRDSRGVRCSWHEIAITSGSQQALFMLGHLLLHGGTAVYMEDPGYPGARRSWEQANARIVPVPVDAEGMRLPLPPANDGTLVYVTPSHQFPMGYCMSLARRLELLRSAHERNLWIVEDDYDAELRYASAPQPSLQSLDEHGRVIYVGTFSKILFPGLRLGYVVLPPELVEPFAYLKMALDDHGPLLDQATLASFLESGAFYSHLGRCRRVYRQRQELFLDLVYRKGLPFSFPVRGRGMNLAGQLNLGVDDHLLSEHLQANGLDVPSLSGYATEAVISGLLFGLTAYDERAIIQGVDTLSIALTSFLKTHQTADS